MQYSTCITEYRVKITQCSAAALGLSLYRLYSVVLADLYGLSYIICQPIENVDQCLDEIFLRLWEYSEAGKVVLLDICVRGAGMSKASKRACLALMRPRFKSKTRLQTCVELIVGYPPCCDSSILWVTNFCPFTTTTISEF